MRREYYSKSERETEAIGAEIARSCKQHDFIAMRGEMGSGKTVFMRGFVSVFAPDALVTSPTYAILNVYEGEDICVNHFDLYRVTDEDDLISTGYEEVIRNGITVCEWSENIPEALPANYLRITFEKLGENERRLIVEEVVR